MSLPPPPSSEALPLPAANQSDRGGGPDGPAGPDVSHEVQPAPVPAPIRHATTMAIALGTFVLGVVVGIALPVASSGSGGVEPSGSPSPTGSSAPLADAYDLCNVADTGGEIADEQTTLILDTQGEDDATGVDYTAVVCVLAHLDTPERVTQTMDSTRALDGRVTDSWDSFTASWSYHPNTGLDIVISTP